MKTAKKLLTVLLAGVLALGVLTGCGSETINTASIAKMMMSVMKSAQKEAVVEEDTRLTEVLKEYLQSKNGIVNKSDIFDNSGKVKDDVKTAVQEALKKKGVELKNADATETKEATDKDVYIAVTLTDDYDLVEQTLTLYEQKKPIQETWNKWKGPAGIGTATGKWTDGNETVNVRFAIMVFDSVPRS